MEQRNLIIGIILLVLALSSNWMISSAPTHQPNAGPEEHKIDYYVRNFTTTLMGEQGEPFRRLSAELMVHYPDDDTTELTKPYITMFEQMVPEWKIASETGWLSGDGDLLLLQGKVTIDRPKTPIQEPVRIVTSDLRVQPNQNYAETEEQITIDTPDNRITSKGMQAWLTNPMRIKFSANVRGRYEVDK
ncbi:MAG: LPS export ABC transporter periplasmic protein LptC [Gammaproteobacteria bacterium]|nr:LPS export ABC transporter periplasmic protein LptC [Gammaproteobacteria bacterium]